MRLKKFWKRLKRFWYRWRNSDPVYHCNVYREEGCSHVDGMLCDFPNCSIYHEYMGHEWVGCAGCEYNESCCSKNYGLGCYEGKAIKK